MLHYNITDALLPYDERPYYVEVSCKDDSGNEVSIITNRALEGRWIRSGSDYKQIRGTLQYYLPKSASGIRNRLRIEMQNLLFKRHEV